MKRAVIIPGFLVLLLLIPVLLKINGSKQTEIVDTYVVKEKIIRSSILASGSIVYDVQATLTTEVIGKVKSILVKEGDRVDKDEVVLRIDPRAFEAEVRQYQALVRIGEIAIEKQKLIVEDLERQALAKESLYGKKLLNEDSFKTVVHQLELARIDLQSNAEKFKQAQARLKEIQENLEKTIVRSPIAGLVTTLSIKEGETAIAGTTNIVGSELMIIADTSSLISEVNVDEADIAKVEIGQEVEVNVVSHSDLVLDGRVNSIANSARKVAGRQGLSFPVKIDLEYDHDLILLSGMSNRAEIFINDNTSSIAVPLQALLFEDNIASDEQIAYLIINRDGIAEKRIVEPGLSDDTFQALVSGVELGEMVVSGPYKTIKYLQHGDRLSQGIN